MMKINNTTPELIPKEEEADLHLMYNNIKISLHLLYAKQAENCERTANVHEIINKIDTISKKLISIRTLEDCAIHDFSNFTNSDVYSKALRYHEEKLREYDLMWWERLAKTID
ncbi:hypothetical protein RI129_001228 [Pyrocoelia pectoralis]|uniref:Uncharacterized protein n=1 Tax=Pyrocoelia pectoralis TaxID=417401 RepID=A0AAN7VTS6_9COLE